MLCDGVHSMGNQEQLVPRGYFRCSEKCENIVDLGTTMCL
jgi:hypothetical protein